MSETSSEKVIRPEQARELARKDFNFLAGLVMPSTMLFMFPEIFCLLAQLIFAASVRERDFSKFAFGIPRGFAKTTWAKVVIVAQILFFKKSFIVVCNNEQSLAVNTIADVFDMLSEPNIVKLFGDWRSEVSVDRGDFKKFRFQGRDVIVRAIGINTSVRGIIVKNKRPDFILLDDVQSREQADSELESSRIYNWIFGTLLYVRSPFGCQYLFLANMYPTQHSILRKLKSNSSWTKFICGAICSDGTSLWEDLFPIAMLVADYKEACISGTRAQFQSEMLNDENATVNSTIDLATLPIKPDVSNQLHQGNFIVIDPSNAKRRSNATAIGYAEIYDGIPHCEYITAAQLSPGDTIKKALVLCSERNCSYIFIEANAYQYSLLYWFNEVTKAARISGITVLPVYSGSDSKAVRILSMFNELKAGKLFYAKDTKALIENEIISYNPLTTNNVDDCLDALTYMPKIAIQYRQELYNATTLSIEDLSSNKSSGVISIL